MRIWQEIQALPRPVRLTPLVIAMAVPAVAEPLPCDATLTLSEGAGDRVAISLVAPCVPYTRLRLDLGPIAVVEETDVDGNLSVEVPRLPGADAISVDILGTVLAAPLPPRDAAPAPHWAVLAEGVAPQIAGPVEVVGFPSALPGPLAYLVPGADTPLRLTIPVPEDRCGDLLAMEVLRPGAVASEPLQVNLPACSDPEAAGVRLVVPID